MVQLLTNNQGTLIGIWVEALLFGEIDTPVHS